MVARTKPILSTERLQALTDGVLAIVLTILVLTFEVPDHRFGHDALRSFFLQLAHPFFAYLASFGIVAAYWVQHTAIFHYVAIGNRAFTWLNLLFLLPLTLLPFLTDLRATYRNEYVTTLLFASANIICSLVLLALWSYAKRNGLLRDAASRVDRSVRGHILAGIAINVLGAAVAPINTYLSSIVFVSLTLVYMSNRVVDTNWSTDNAGVTNAAADG